MKIRILTSARKDLADGRDFYDRQAEGVGGYPAWTARRIAPIEALRYG